MIENCVVKSPYEDTKKPMASPKANSPKFRSIEGGIPYDPSTSEAEGQTRNGHQLFVVAVLNIDSLTVKAAAAVSSRASKISFVMFFACLSMDVWSSTSSDSFSVAARMRSTPCSRAS